MAGNATPANQPINEEILKELVIDSEDLGFKTLYEPKDGRISVDIIAVHGLGEHPDKAWTYCSEQTNHKDVNWLKDTDMLPAELPKARIMTFGYNSTWYGPEAVRQRLSNIAKEMLTDLMYERKDCQDRPIVFVGHCLGGLVMQKVSMFAVSPQTQIDFDPVHQAYILAKTIDDDYPGIGKSVTGMVFIGTPHRGAGGALSPRGRISQAIAAKGLLIEESILETLEEGNETLVDVVKEYTRLINLKSSSIEVYCFFEMKQTVVGKIVGDRMIRETIVDEDSGTLFGHRSAGLVLDHYNLNKYKSSKDLHYIRVSRQIVSMVEGSKTTLEFRSIDKERIEGKEDKLLGLYGHDISRWILDNKKFTQWRDDARSNLLWIKGDPGKGKTMLLCGIIEELGKASADPKTLAYFFCQATNANNNNATAVLRCLIYSLVVRQPTLISYVREKYDQDQKFLEGVNALPALARIFTNILKDEALKGGAYLIIDALDECTTQLPDLLKFIVGALRTCPHIKWIVSSRNWPSIEKELDTAHTTQNSRARPIKLSLELNKTSVSKAVTKYIKTKVAELARQYGYSKSVRVAVQDYLKLNANGTFLWVALVCRELDGVSSLRAREKVAEFPSGLNELYKRMMDQICHSKNDKLCRDILAITSLMRRPIELEELAAFINSSNDQSTNISTPDDVFGNDKALREAIGLCGSFLTIQKRTILFVHQSAKDYLMEHSNDKIFPGTGGRAKTQQLIVLRSINAMRKILQKDIYDTHDLGCSVETVKCPEPDPLAPIRYACVHWVDHLDEIEINRDDHLSEIKSNHDRVDLRNGGTVDTFLKEHLLHWLEALSLMRSISDGVFAMNKLAGLLETWDTDSGNCLQTFGSYGGFISPVALSNDKSQIVLGFHDGTVKIRDLRSSGYSLPTLNSDNSVASIAVSNDGLRIVLGMWNGNVDIWDTNSSNDLLTLGNHSCHVAEVAFSNNGLWGDLITPVTFSNDWLRVAEPGVGGGTMVIRYINGRHLRSFPGSSDDPVCSAAFSNDGLWIASGLQSGKINTWDVNSGDCLQIFRGHSHRVTSVAVSNDKSKIASGAILLDSTPPATALQQLQEYRYGLSTNREWVTWQDANLVVP
ncbi:NACHT-domain-containing protein [Drechslerella dactyloides]|uniref:NACHT-domain-containing protein n=1 Tax=Drechslerella dactyloides TaxID=74499 RepID=A0AAD6NG36_DREDA|nr:NACHT-domain-containing protein [Drechslerella dactyloides]